MSSLEESGEAQLGLTNGDGDGEIKVAKKRSLKRKVEEMDTDEVANETGKAPIQFPPAKERNMGQACVRDIRKIRVPQHRRTPLKENWAKIFTPLVEHLQLQVRYVPKNYTVEIKASNKTTESGALQRGEDFVRAFVLGFEVDDALALLRLDELYLETFQVEDVKTLKGDHMSRCIGRLAGKGGRTKFTIENTTKTRIVLADNKIHILGSFQNIRAARTAVCNLILGKPPSKVYGSMRMLAARVSQRL
ncbi:RNA-binding protein pno1-like [Varroa jacobsoni]|uniref:K Homology domain-containing protein n=1 Tax=Varroa destructor TaxID=109461 RepID=A0A7M7J3X9_VARDE|nr:RNA-binding protein pno1-like [Varroa destructor]XP_022698964.1 RNA-binding protein pno1-like [Varroa jacobsoni]